MTLAQYAPEEAHQLENIYRRAYEPEEPKVYVSEVVAKRRLSVLRYLCKGYTRALDISELFPDAGTYAIPADLGRLRKAGLAKTERVGAIWHWSLTPKGRECIGLDAPMGRAG